MIDTEETKQGGIEDDPHQSRVAPDDPRLKLPTLKTRSLKKGPVIAIGSGLLLIILVAFALAVLPNKKNSGKKDDAEVTQQFTIPDKIRQAPDNRTPVMIPPADSIPQLGKPLPGDLGNAMIQNNQRGAVQQQKVRTPEETERDAAIKASPFFGGGNGSSATAASLPSSLSSAGFAGTTPAVPAYGQGQNSQDRKNDFFATGGGPDKEYLSKGMHQPVSKYEVKAGSVIPIILVTGINSDLPGNVVGMVKENVYDSKSGDYLLIPQGTRVLGKYDSMVSYGQKRVLVSWGRMIRPDGSSIVLEGMPGVDLAGNAGYKDKVDNHYGRLIGGALLSSVLSVGATLSQGSNYTNTTMSPQQQMAASVGEEINRTGSQITRKNLDIQPTLIIRAGKSVNILVNKDMVISPYNANS